MGYIIGSTAYCETPTNLESCRNAQSYTICKTIELLDCDDCETLVVNNGLMNCDCEDSWNCNLCSNDLPYFNPVNVNDFLYFQFQQPDPLNGNDPEVHGVYGWGTAAYFEIYNCCNDELIIDGDMSVVDKAFVGLFQERDYKGNITYTNVQQICFNVDAIISLGFGNFDSDHCFYFKFYFITNDDPDKPEFDTVCSEPFKLNYCRNITVLLEGELTGGRDCFNYWYGGSTWNVGTFFNYVNQYRVRGSLEFLSTGIEKETVTRFEESVNSLKFEDYSLNTYGIPFEVHRLIAEIMNAKRIFVDGNLFQLQGTIDKNNDQGSFSFPQIPLRRYECFKDYSCSPRRRPGIQIGL